MFADGLDASRSGHEFDRDDPYTDYPVHHDPLWKPPYRTTVQKERIQKEMNDSLNRLHDEHLANPCSYTIWSNQCTWLHCQENIKKTKREYARANNR